MWSPQRCSCHCHRR
ncbi:MAG TPA: hypothetical protein EYH06_13265 [Chromatiales bacterium]|nr:hypothetical protein [Thiotrichales bacterium]HIP69533.1 hypothetical protein [Chromatiales bacterium]